MISDIRVTVLYYNKMVAIKGVCCRAILNIISGLHPIPPAGLR